jgi:hypothetical protein
MVKQWIKKLARRLRIARYERRETNRHVLDRAHAEHLERVRQGIKDNMSPGGPI